MGLVFKPGKRKDDPFIELTTDNIYLAALGCGCSHETAWKLVQAINQAEEEEATIEEVAEKDLPTN